MRPQGLLQFKMSDRLIFGIGALQELPGAITSLGCKNPMIVTDQGLVRAGIVDQVTAVLDQAGIAPTLFDKVEPDPRMDIMDDCATAARQANADLLIGLGGGSSLDTSKVASILLTNGGNAIDYAGTDLVPGPGIPKIAIPTTSGTGSEVTPIAVLSDKKAHLKKGVVSDYCYPTIALVDPALTASLPPQITAYTGIDALTHCIESYVSRFSQPFVDALVLEGIRLIGGNLRRAVACGYDLDARYAMSLGSLYGGMCLGPVNTGGVHALAYPLGGMYNVPHGIANSLLLPYVMRFNMTADLEKFANIAVALGEPIDGLSPREAASKAVDAAEQLCEDAGIVRRMRDLGVPESGIDEMAEAAMLVTRILEKNPRKIGVEDARAIYRAAW